MKTYIYYSKVDPEKEPQGVIKAKTLDEAYLISSQIKQLDLDKFKEIFKVEKKNG